MLAQSFARLTLLALCTALCVAIATPAMAASPAGDYSACNLQQGSQFRLASSGPAWVVSVRTSPAAAWRQEPSLPLRAVSPASLASLNASVPANAHASWALPWEGAYFLRLPSGWTSQAGIRPDLVLVGAGQALMLCRVR